MLPDLLRDFFAGETFLGYLGCGPLTVTVTTRIITFLVGDPYKPSFPTVTGRGPYPRDTTIHKSMISKNTLPVVPLPLGRTGKNSLGRCSVWMGRFK